MNVQILQNQNTIGLLKELFKFAIFHGKTHLNFLTKFGEVAEDSDRLQPAVATVTGPGINNHDTQLYTTHVYMQHINTCRLCRGKIVFVLLSIDRLKTVKVTLLYFSNYSEYIKSVLVLQLVSTMILHVLFHHC